MREFVLFSRQGFTGSRFKGLRDAGRLDTVYQCILMALFRSHGIRRDVRFHAFLNGPPSPPLHLMVDGAELRDARVDEETWEVILRNALGRGTHPGITVDKTTFQLFVRERSEAGCQIYVLEEKGAPIREAEIGPDPVFILGDHIGLPKKDEGYALRYGTKISLGKGRYLAASCIDIVNYELDSRL